MTNEPQDEQSLERLMRAGLERRAGDADISVPVADRARTAARRRRGGRIAAGVAAVAVAAVAVTGVVIDRSSSPGGDGTPNVVDDPTSGPLPTQWRTEYWHDTQVDVPADWGWGPAPVHSGARGSDDLYFCGGPGATVLADGHLNVNGDESVPYVGRPIRQSDMCVGGDPLTNPQASYVWLGADIEPGTVDLDNGFLQETREVNGSTVTVGTRDADLRERILDSATGGETCMSNLEAPPRVESKLTEGMGKVDSAQLCVYRSESGQGFDLVYARELDGRSGQEFEDAAYAAEVSSGCEREQPGFEYAVLTLTGDDPYGTEPVSQDYVVDTGCARIETSPGQFHVLTEANVKPWAVGGIPAIMSGPMFSGVDWAQPYFIGGWG